HQNRKHHHQPKPALVATSSRLAKSTRTATVQPTASAKMMVSRGMICLPLLRWVGDMSTTLEGEHVHALRSRERGRFLVVQTLWVEKIQSTTDAGSLNTFGRNEIEVAPISSALLRIACLVILYKTCVFRGTEFTYRIGVGLAASGPRRLPAD